MYGTFGAILGFLDPIVDGGRKRGVGRRLVDTRVLVKGSPDSCPYGPCVTLTVGVEEVVVSVVFVRLRGYPRLLDGRVTGVEVISM